MDFNLILQSFVIPGMALVFPIVLIIFITIRDNLKFYVPIKRGIGFLIIFILLSIILSLLLLYLTGSINYYYYLEPGITVTESSIDWKVTNHYRILIQFQGGIALVVIAILSALIYASLIALPPKIVYSKNTLQIMTNLNTKEEQIGGNANSTTITSSFTAFLSAFSSTAVCCTTSVAAILAPSISLLLAPYVPILLLVSYILLLYSFSRIVLPKISM